jgi:hypothetical protein
MSVTTSHHLTLIDAANKASTTAGSLHRLMVRAVVGAPLDQQIPPTVLEHLEDLDAVHETACDVYDLASAELDTTRQALTDAAAAYQAVNDAWQKAGLEMDAAARTAAATRKAAGVVLTASGYRPVSP